MDQSGNIFATADESNGDGSIFEYKFPTASLSSVTPINPSSIGTYPTGLTMDAAGNLYGTAPIGGPGGGGAVFEISGVTHNVSVIGVFNGTNGSEPSALPFVDAAGNVYGTTADGGTGYTGVLYEIPASTRQLTVLGSFNQYNGSGPDATPAVDAAGNVYGTATLEGAPFGIFKYDPVAKTLNAIYGAQNWWPGFGLQSGANGQMYGITPFGGDDGFGAIFKFNPANDQVSELAAFNGANGKEVGTEMLADSDGNLFGISEQGGANGSGDVFEFNQGTGELSAVYSFPAGQLPNSALIADGRGDLFGTAITSGSNPVSTLYELTGTGFAVPEPGSLPVGIGLLFLAIQSGVLGRGSRPQ